MGGGEIDDSPTLGRPRRASELCSSCDRIMSTSLHQLLKERPNDILNRFVSQVQSAGAAPPGLPRSLLVDHIPSFLGELAEQLAGSSAVASILTESSSSRLSTRSSGATAGVNVRPGRLVSTISAERSLARVSKVSRHSKVEGSAQ